MSCSKNQNDPNIRTKVSNTAETLPSGQVKRTTTTIKELVQEGSSCNPCPIENRQSNSLPSRGKKGNCQTSFSNSPAPAPPPDSQIPCSPNCAAAGQKIKDSLMQSVRQSIDEQLDKTKYKRAQSSAKSISKSEIPVIQTQKGKETVIQQITLEKKVDRGPEGEHTIKHLTGVHVDDKGEATQIDVNLQHLDTSRRTEESEVVTVISSVAITSKSKKLTKRVIKESSRKSFMDPKTAAKLIDEEINDINEIMKKMIPDLVADAPKKHYIRKKVREINMSPDLLDQPITPYIPTADEALCEIQPETIATIMNTLEKGLTEPNQFGEFLPDDEVGSKYLDVGSIIPGYLHDVVVPIEFQKQMPDCVFTSLEEELMNVENIPDADSYTVRELEVPNLITGLENEGEKPEEEEGGEEREEQNIGWEGEYKELLLKLVGAFEVENLEPNETVENGIDYFIEAEPNPYISRFQLRGNSPPSWFPGHYYATLNPHFLTKSAKNIDEVLLSAWRTVNPKDFSNSNKLSI